LATNSAARCRSVRSSPISSRELKLIIELDGFSHEVDPGRDIWRDKHLHEAGYRVLHFPNAEVLANVEGVVTMIRFALNERPTPGPSRKREGGR